MKKIVFFFTVIGMIVVNVNSTNAQCDSSLSINASQWLICHDDSIKLTSPIGDIWTGSSFTSYSWVYSAEGSESVSLLSNTNIAWIKKPKAGRVSLTVTKSKGGCMYGDIPLVDVAPVVKFKSNSIMVKNHDTVTFKNSDDYITTEAGNVNCLTTYYWYDINTKKVESSNPNAFGFTGSAYVLKVVNNDNRQCATFSDTVTILISKPTGLSVVETEDILVYPNPFVGFINLDNIKNGTMLRVIDISGKEVYKNISNGDNLQIDSSIWSSGVYTLFVGDSTKKIIKY